MPSPSTSPAPDAIPAIEAALAAQRAYADVLVNSAGMGLAGPFHAQRAGRDVLQLLDLNVRALTALTRHFLAGMRVRGRGGILNLASLGGYAPGPNQAVYYASKAYVLSLTEAIAAETAGEGVRDTRRWRPGPVNTRFHARMGAEHAPSTAIWLPPPPPRRVARAGYSGLRAGAARDRAGAGQSLPGIGHAHLAA